MRLLGYLRRVVETRGLATGTGGHAMKCLLDSCVLRTVSSRMIKEGFR